MKQRKSIISCLLVLSLILSILSVGAVTVQAVSDSIIGVWDGTYMGSLGGQDIDRTIRIDITACDENNNIEGFAEIEGGTNGKYFLNGSFNSEDNSISFQGKEWLTNPSSFGFAAFSGTLNTESMTIEGSIDNNTSKNFSLTKVSDTPHSYELDLENINTDFDGEYDGHHNGTVVRRNIEIHIEDIAENGDIKGRAILSPSEKAEAVYGANGSYYFKGHINAKLGTINMQGYEWIDYPIQYDNFTFVNLTGYIDAGEAAIKGTSENGIWDMSFIDYSKIHTKSGFTLGKNNNSFVHTSSSDWVGAGFRNMNNYKIGNKYFSRLTRYSSPSEKNKLKKKMNEKWGGSCYGIAMSMGLLYEGYIKVEDLTDSDLALNYFTMPYPCNDSKLRNTINYYQLSQYLENGGKKSAVATAYNNHIFASLLGWKCKDESLSVFLKKLVNYASSDHIELLGFSTSKGGHAILVTGCRYDSFEQKYILEMYDENCIDTEIDTGNFIEMTIDKDFGRFTFTDSNGEVVDNASFRSIYFLDWKNLGNIVETSESVEENNHTKLVLSLDEEVTVTDSDGRYLTVKDGQFSGDMNVYSANIVENSGIKGDGVSVIFETDNTASLTLSEMKDSVSVEAYNDNGFSALSGSDIESASMELGKQIQINGTEYSFEAFTSTGEIDDGENGMISVSADATDSVTVSVDNNEVKVDSENPLRNPETKNYSQSDVVVTRHGDGNSVTDNAEAIIEKALGDVNGDGIIDSVDRAYITRFVAGWKDYESIHVDAADFNKDGIVNAKDRIFLSRHLALWEGYTELPAE